MRLGILLQGLLVVSVAADSLDSRTINSIEKRATPKISGFSGQQMIQVEDGASDLLEMIKVVLNTRDDVVDHILKKYFLEDNRAKVLGVFDKISGRDASGNPIIKHLTIKNNDEDTTDSDWEEDYALLLGENTSKPRLVLFPDSLKKGGIDKSYPGVAAVTCESIGTQLSDRMETLGSVIMHEYMHWKYLVIPPLNSACRDLEDGYGAYNTRNSVPKHKAIKNADSFTWFAIELYWTVKCGRYFSDPVPTSYYN